MNNELNNLIECITDIRGIISSSCLNIVCDDILKEIKEPIDVDKFKTWFNYNLNNFKSKTNQTSYFKKAFTNELVKGTFEKAKVYYVPATEPMINELRSKGITILADESAYLYTMWEELLNHYKVPREIGVQVNRQAINSLTITSDFKHYVQLIQNCDLLKSYKIDWADIKDKTDAFIKRWNETLDELEKSYE